MEDNEKLLQRIEALEQRVKFLEETFETLSDIGYMCFFACNNLK